MSPRHLPRTTHEGRAGNRRDNLPLGPTGPSPDRVRRLNSERHHPANYLGKITGPPQAPGAPRPDRHPHPLVAHRPLPPPVHDPQHDPHAPKFVDFDPGTDTAMEVTSPIRPPRRRTRDGRIKPREFGRRP